MTKRAAPRPASLNAECESLYADVGSCNLEVDFSTDDSAWTNRLAQPRRERLLEPVVGSSGKEFQVCTVQLHSRCCSCFRAWHPLNHPNLQVNRHRLRTHLPQRPPPPRKFLPSRAPRRPYSATG